MGSGAGQRVCYFSNLNIWVDEAAQLYAGSATENNASTIAAIVAMVPEEDDDRSVLDVPLLGLSEARVADLHRP
jgi:hypothetical protein